MKFKKNLSEMNIYYKQIEKSAIPAMILVCFALLLLHVFEILTSWIPLLTYSGATITYLLIYFFSKKDNLIIYSFLLLTIIQFLIISFYLPFASLPLIMLGLCLVSMVCEKNLIIIYYLISSLGFFSFNYFYHFITFKKSLIFIIIFSFATISLHVLVKNFVKLYEILLTAKNKELDLIKRTEQDPLTKILNKTSTENYINYYLTYHQTDCAFFMIDIDDFKKINDQFGHDTGDVVIVEFAKKLKKVFRETDVIGRVGGDEFVVFMKNIESAKDVQEKAKLFQKEISAISRSLSINKIITTSIGIALNNKEFNGSKKENFHDFFIKADHALYQAKNLNKNTFKFYQE